MFRARLNKLFLPITWHLVIFMAVALAPAAISAYLSLQQANTIQEQAQIQTGRRASRDLLREIHNIGRAVMDSARRLAASEETLSLFYDSTYYHYWRESRVREALIYQDISDAVELFGVDGRPLVPDVALASAVHVGATEHPLMLMHQDRPYLLYFRPVKRLRGTEEQLLGYVGIRVDVTHALEKSGVLTQASIERIEWNFPVLSGTTIDEAVATATITVSPSQEVNAFLDLVRRSFWESLIYTAVLLAILAAFLSLTIARPLRRLAAHLHAADSGTDTSIPSEVLGASKIRELENVRRALNDYRDRFRSAAASLEEKNRELTHLTYHDPLTGCFNRRAFESHVEQAIYTANREGKRYALCYLDLDQFKVVNDTCGHIAGDELLKQLAAILSSQVRTSDMIARLGGDEFGVLLEGCETDKAIEIAEGMRLKIKKHRFVWEGKPFDLSVSIGLVPIDSSYLSGADALKNADAACYVAKDSGRNRLQVYQSDDKELAQRHGEMQWVSRIRQALETDAFVLFGQEIRKTTRPLDSPHYEILVRMRGEDGKLVAPMAFIPAAERYNLMASIDEWVIRRAMTMLAEANRRHGAGQLALSINLSGQSLGNAETLALVKRCIQQHGLDPATLCFEITETAAITNLSTAVQFIRALRAIGCRFSLDDFGSGLSSFGYLGNLEVDYIKIDGHFVRNILSDPLSRSIVNAVNDIGHTMGIRTIAEFVENESAIAVLQALGVDYVQGYGVHKPEPFTDILTSSRLTSSTD